MPRFSSSAALARAFFFAALLTLPPAAAAASEPSAAELVEQGLRLRRARQDADALEAFRRAYQAQPSPMILAQIALAEQALGQFLAAEQHLSESLRSKDAWVEERRTALDTALAVIQSRLGWLEVSTNAEHAELLLDDEPKDLASSPFRVTAGTHQLVLRTADHVFTPRTVEVRGGQRQVYQLELSEPAPSPRVEPPSVRSPPAAAPARTPRATQPSRDVQTWAYVTATVAGMALLEAVAASVLRQGFVDDYNSPSCAPDRSERCAANRHSANTFGTIALVGYAAAGMAGATSVALFTEPWWNRSSAPSSGAMVGVSGAF